MRIIGIDISGSEAILCVLDSQPKGWDVVETATRKLKLHDSKSSDQVKECLALLEAFFREQKPGRVVIKQRAGRGGFAGGGTSFKIEGLIQIASTVGAEIISPVAIAATLRKKTATRPDSLYAYQEDAFRVALTAHHKQ